MDEIELLRDVTVLNLSRKLSSSTEMYHDRLVMVLLVYGFLRFFSERCRTISEGEIQSRIYTINYTKKQNDTIKAKLLFSPLSDNCIV